MLRFKRNSTLENDKLSEVRAGDPGGIVAPTISMPLAANKIAPPRDIFKCLQEGPQEPTQAIRTWDTTPGCFLSREKTRSQAVNRVGPPSDDFESGGHRAPYTNDGEGMRPAMATGVYRTGGRLEIAHERASSLRRVRDPT